MIKGMMARQVVRLLVVCGVGNGKCRGQVIQIQERKQLKPRPMLAVCQLTDVRGGVRGRQQQRMESTLLEGRGRARRRLGEAQDADEGEMVTQVMPDDGRNQSGGVRAPRESGRGREASRALAGGVRGREREKQEGPGDPGEEATTDASRVSAHGRAGGERGMQRELMGRTLLEMRGRSLRRLGEVQDADEGEMFSEVMPGGGSTADRHQTDGFRVTVTQEACPNCGLQNCVGVGLDPTTVLLSEVSDWMEQSAHVIRICGERYTPPHKWSHLQGVTKLWSASAVRDLS